MAIAEACQLWIEQRIEEELQDKDETGKSLREIGRELAAEIEKVFEAKVSPDTLRKRAERMGGTNVPDAETPATTPKSVATSGYKEDAISEVSRLHGEIVGAGGGALVEKLARRLTPQEVVKEVDSIVKKGMSVRGE